MVFTPEPAVQLCGTGQRTLQARKYEISHPLTRRGGRTYGWTILSLPKFLECIDNQIQEIIILLAKFITHVLRCACFTRARAPLSTQTSATIAEFSLTSALFKRTWPLFSSTNRPLAGWRLKESARVTLRRRKRKKKNFNLFPSCPAPSLFLILRHSLWKYQGKPLRWIRRELPWRLAIKLSDQ